MSLSLHPFKNHHYKHNHLPSNLYSNSCEHTTNTSSPPAATSHQVQFLKINFVKLNFIVYHKYCLGDPTTEEERNLIQHMDELHRVCVSFLPSARQSVRPSCLSVHLAPLLIQKHTRHTVNDYRGKMISGFSFSFPPWSIQTHEPPEMCTRWLHPAILIHPLTFTNGGVASCQCPHCSPPPSDRRLLTEDIKLSIALISVKT